MSLTTCKKIGRCEILGAIGAVELGEVYPARTAKLGRDVALKVLPEAFVLDGGHGAVPARDKSARLA